MNFRKKTGLTSIIILSLQMSISFFIGGCVNTPKKNDVEKNSIEKTLTISLVPNDKVSTLKLLQTTYSIYQDTITAVIFNNTNETIYKSSFFAFDYFEPELNIYKNVLPSNLAYTYSRQRIEPYDSVEVTLSLSIIENRKPGEYRLTLHIFEPVVNYMVANFTLVDK